MRPSELVVVGASLAGLRAVESARRAGFGGTITLVGDEPHLPYDRPPLSKAVLDAQGHAVDTTFRDEAVLRDELDVELRLGSSATGLDCGRRVVQTDSGEVGFDALVIATGASPRPLPGTSGLGGVHTLRTRRDALAIREAMDAGARTVVVGAGFIGSEAASAARKRGLDVTIVEALPAPLGRAIGAEMGVACAALHKQNDVDLRCGVRLEGLDGDRQVERVRLSDGSSVEADLVVVGIGADPAVDWLRGSGLDVDGGVVCDETLATSVPGIYAAGDVARWPNPVFGESMRLEHWTSAAEQGAVAARNAIGADEVKAYATVPYFWSDWYGTRIQFVGIPSADEVRVAYGDPDSGRFVALYRRGTRLVGALAVHFPAHIMKYRSAISRGVDWDEGLDLAGRLAARS